MTTKTSGHLSNNGGIRGHSAGDFYPYRVMIQGTFDNLKYHVINPQGDKVAWFSSAWLACHIARILHASGA